MKTRRKARTVRPREKETMKGSGSVASQTIIPIRDTVPAIGTRACVNA